MRIGRSIAMAAVLVAVFALAPGVAMAGTAASITASEGQQLTIVVVDSLSTCNPASLQNIMITWGDGNTSSGSAFEAGPNGCDIAGSHKYTEEGSYTTEVSYSFVGGGLNLDSGAATVADAAVSPSAVSDFTVPAGSSVSLLVANWMDAAPEEALSSYSATIDWGDGHSSAGTIFMNGDITGSHTYVNGGRFTITVTFQDEGGASGVAHEHAIVTGCPTSAPNNPSPPFSPPDVGLDIRYVEALYHDILGRAPSPGELTAATNALSLGETRNQLVLSILQRSEYRKNLIASEYERYLRRIPTPSETTAQLAFLGGGASDESLAAHILGSAEYFASRGNDSNDGFLGAIYCDAVFRSIDQFNQNNDDAALGGGTSRATIAAGVMGSTEYLGKLVNGFYLHYLRRPGTPAERAGVAASIKSGGSDEKALTSLLSSTEYYDIFNPKVAFISTLIAQGNTFDTTLSRDATLRLTVLRIVPLGHASAVKVRPPHTKLVGVINFGPHHKGRVKLHWDRKVHGKRLKRGKYLLVLKAYNGHKLIGVTDAVRFSVH